LLLLLLLLLLLWLPEQLPEQVSGFADAVIVLAALQEQSGGYDSCCMLQLSYCALCVNSSPCCRIPVNCYYEV
jgi:hypothetical protein